MISMLEIENRDNNRRDMLMRHTKCRDDDNYEYLRKNLPDQVKFSKEHFMIWIKNLSSIRIGEAVDYFIDVNTCRLINLGNGYVSVSDFYTAPTVHRLDPGPLMPHIGDPNPNITAVLDIIWNIVSKGCEYGTTVDDFSEKETIDDVK